MSVERFKRRPEILRTRQISECSTSSNIPLQFINSSYNNNDDCESRGSSDSQMEVPSPMETLQIDGLCQNTYENISVAGNLDSFEEKCDSDNTTVRVGCTSPLRRTVFFSLLFFMCAFALALSIMMTLQVNSNCSCYSSKDARESSGKSKNGSFEHRIDDENSDEQTTYKMLRDNMTKLEQQLRNYNLNKFKDDFSSFTERIDEQYRLLKENYSKLENRIDLLEQASSQINNVKNFFWTTLNNTVDIVKKEFGEYYKDMNNTFAAHKNKILNLREIQHQSSKMLKEYYREIFGNFTKMKKTVENCTRKLNETKEDVDTTNSTLRNEMERLKSDVINEIQNVSKMEGPQGPMGPRGLEGLRGPPGFNGTSRNSPGSANGNFSMCQYNHKTKEIGQNDAITERQVNVTEPEGKRIVGATCSTDTAKEYHFVYLKDKDGRNVYKCVCLGQNPILPKSCKANHICCTLHYWECPFVT